MNDPECIGDVSVMCRLSTRDFIEYFRGSSQELNHHLVSARRSCRSWICRQLRINREQRGVSVRSTMIVGKHSLGEHLLGAVRA